MKNCKKWFDDKCYKRKDCMTDSSGRDIDCGVCTGLSEEAWRAALEWALKTAEQIEREDAPVFMNDIIREELNEMV